MRVDVADGSLADIWRVQVDVGFTPESGRQSHALACPLWANRRLMQQSKYHTRL